MRSPRERRLAEVERNAACVEQNYMSIPHNAQKAAAEWYDEQARKCGKKDVNFPDGDEIQAVKGKFWGKRTLIWSELELPVAVRTHSTNANELHAPRACR